MTLRDVPTFSWLKTWGPPLVAFAVVAAGVGTTWSTLRAEAQDLRRTDAEIERRVTAVETRADGQEKAQRQLEKKIDELDRKLQLVVCRLIPGSPGCP